MIDKSVMNDEWTCPQEDLHWLALIVMVVTPSICTSTYIFLLLRTLIKPD